MSGERFETTTSQVFEVDKETRTIKGLALPFGVVGENANGRFQFDADADYTWPADLTRLKLFSGHDYTRPIGYATRVEKTDRGIETDWKIGRGAAGDAALTDAEDHVSDGLSVGLGKAAKFAIRDGVQHGVVVPIAEVSQTPLPAFDDARVISVAASAVTTEGNEAVTETPPTEDVTGRLARIESALERFTAAVPPREPNPTATVVREEPPYRFDAAGGRYSLLGDVEAANARADGAAAQRLEAFLGEAFAAIATGDVDDLNPTVNRPEMYVGPLRYNRPLWGLVTTGGISDSTPFMFPRFSTKTGKGIDDHVQGVEPTEFSITTTSQTVTPTALSGLAILNREVYDQGGNPSIDRIIWDEMMSDYFEHLEVAVAALLATGTGAEINIGAGATDAAKVALLKSELVKLQFTKGGDRFQAFAGGPALYGLLANAVDADGRPLLPVVNATNADGTVRAGYDAIQIGNRSVIPAWALANEAAPNAEESYLFARESVHAWVSAPKRIDLQLAVKEVRIGIWGYKATALTRATDVIPVDASTLDA